MNPKNSNAKIEETIRIRPNRTIGESKHVAHGIGFFGSGIDRWRSRCHLGRRPVRADRLDTVRGRLGARDRELRVRTENANIGSRTKERRRVPIRTAAPALSSLQPGLER